MHESDGARYRCAWIEDSITVHSDGNVSCGLDDPHSQRTFGNIHSQTIEEIFANPEYRRLQENLWEGRRCVGCDLFQRETVDFAGGVNLRPRMPTTLVVEPTVKCNIRCLNGTACAANNDPLMRTRDSDVLSYEAFASLIDQMKNSLKYVYFFNYGDPFVHARAEDMLQYIRDQCPEAHVVTSTNGIPLFRAERAMKVVEAGLNQITFTIGGIKQESYGRYHVGGDVTRALAGLRNVVEAKRKIGSSEPKVTWRYLLFRWNDSDAEIEEAVKLAGEIGVDEFIFYLTHIPFEGASFRFAPATPNYAKYQDIMDCALFFTKVAGIPQPNNDGFFELDDVAGLGPSYWAGWRARRWADPGKGWIHFSLSTNRPVSRQRPCWAYVVTPWKPYKVPMHFEQWQEVSIPIPETYQAMAPIEVRIFTPDYWFPIAEVASTDPRCLGVLVRADEESVDDAAAIARFQMVENAGPPTEAELSAAGVNIPWREVTLMDGNAGRFGF